MIHKARPQDERLGVSACAVCAAPVKHLPAGQGWVHSETGMVVGSGEDEENPLSTVITVQPAPVVDHLTEEGQELTKLPYPFHVDAADGSIHHQDFWKGDPVRVVGFARRVDVHKVDLWWKDAVADPQQAVGMYCITQDKKGTIATQQVAIASVKANEA